MSERGSMSLLAAAISALILLMGVITMSAAGVVSAAWGAETAAEAAALAAVSPVVRDPVAAARGVAALNRATLVACDCPAAGGPGPATARVVVETTVRVPFFGELRFTEEASAEYVPGLPESPHGDGHPGNEGAGPSRDRVHVPHL